MAESKLTQCQNFFVLLLSFSFILLILFALYYYIHTFAYMCACTHTQTHLFSYFLFVLHVLSIHICSHFGLFMGLLGVYEQVGL